MLESGLTTSYWPQFAQKVNREALSSSTSKGWLKNLGRSTGFEAFLGLEEYPNIEQEP